MMSQDNCTLRCSHPQQKLQALCRINELVAEFVIVLHISNSLPVAATADSGSQYVCSYIITDHTQCIYTLQLTNKMFTFIHKQTALSYFK